MMVRTTGVTKRARQAIFVLALALLAFTAQAQTAKKSLVACPFVLRESVMETKDYSLQDELTKAVIERLKKDPQFAVLTFSRTHPSVRRALAEGSLKSALLLEPFTGVEGGQPKAVTLGRLMRGQLALAGVVDSFEYDAEKKMAKVVVSIELYDIAESKLLGAVAMTAEGAGDTEMAAAKATAAKLAETAVPEAVKILTAPRKKDGGLDAS
jgi:hypothetical protein